MKLIANQQPGQAARVLVLTACVPIIAEALAALFGHPFVATAMAVPGVGLLAVSLYTSRAAAAPEAFTERLQRQVEQGRRLAIYHHDTGLFADWYLAMRLDEECGRAGRYDHALSVILIAIDPSADRISDEDEILSWIRLKLRSVDLAGCLGTARYLLVLPDTDAAGARVLLERLKEVADFDAAIAESPADGTSAGELYAATERRLAETKNAAPPADIRLRRTA